MKHILRMCSLFILMSFVGISLHAEAAENNTKSTILITQLGPKLTNLKNVADGDLILLHNSSRWRNGFVNIAEKAKNQTVLLQEKNLVNALDGELFLIKIHKKGNKYSFELANGEYIPALTNGGNIMTKPAGEQFTLTFNKRNRWTIAGVSNNIHMNANQGAITGWKKSSGGNAAYDIYKPVTVTKHIYLVTYKYNFLGKTLTDSNWVAEGDAPLPSAPSYIAATPQSGSPATITKPVTITYDCKQSQADIPISTDLNHAKWFGFKQRDNSLWVHADTASDGVWVNGELPLTQEVLPYYTWAVVGDWIEGYKIYNQAKKDKPLTIEGNLANLKAGDGTAIELVYTNPQRNWNLRVPGTSQYIGDHLNIGHETDAHAHHLSIWNNPRGLNDGGTNMNPVGQDQIQELVKDTLQKQIEAVFLNTPQGVLNGFQSEETAKQLEKEYRALLDNHPTLVQLNQMLEKVQSQTYRLQVAPNKYYVFISRRNGLALSVNGMDDQLHITAGLQPDTVLNCPNAVVQFVPSSENGKYYLMTCGKYLGKATASVQPSLVADKAEAGLYEVLPTAPGNVAINNTNSADTGNDRSALHCDGQFNVVGWAKGVEPSSWFVVPMDSLDVQLYPADGGTYATLCVPFKVTLPEGLKAYRLDRTNVGKSSFRMLETGSQTIAANTPVLLKGTAEKYVLAIDDDNEAGAISESNLFAGLNLAKSIDKTSVFVFGIDGTTPGFYRPNKTYLKANRAYFMAAGVPASTTGFSLDFGDGTTGISRTLKAGKNEGVYYDLQGRRVQHPVKGVYIKNGKKVVL